MDGFETLALEVLLTCKRNQDTVLRSDGLSVVGWVGRIIQTATMRIQKSDTTLLVTVAQVMLKEW